MSKPPISETIKAKLEQYDVERHVSELATQAEHLLEQGRARAAELAREHRDDLDRLIDRAAHAVDRHTEGRHAARIGQVRLQIERGGERLAEHDQDGGR